MTRWAIPAAFILLVLGGCGATTPTEFLASNRKALTAERTIDAKDDASPLATSTQEMETESPKTCMMTSGSVAAISSVADLIWASERIVVGEIVKIYPSVPDPNAPWQPLYTEYDVRVDKNLRGQAIVMLRVRHGGGQIPGGCTDLQGATTVHIGERFVFFLGYQVEQTDIPTYFVIGEQQGLWKLNGTTVADVVPWYSDITGLPVTDVAMQIKSSLAASPPVRVIAGHYPVVSLDQAPPGPDLPSSATPAP